MALNFFYQLSSYHIFYLIRQQLEHEEYCQKTHLLIEGGFEFGLVNSKSYLYKIAPMSDFAKENLEQYLNRPSLSFSHSELTQQLDNILKQWVKIIYVDGGYRETGRSAWGLYDTNDNLVFSGLGRSHNSHFAEIEALLNACHYASHSEYLLYIVYTDLKAIPDMISIVDDQEYKPLHFAWRKYKNNKFVELYAFLDNFPIDVIWATRDTPGIFMADAACRLELYQQPNVALQLH